jgi:indolepyruvate ferredoxin oxidoreductase
VFELVTGLFGDTTTANVFLLGVAHQAGVLPVSTISLERAISLNGVAVDRNLAAFTWGRQWIIDPDSVAKAAGAHTLVEGAAEPLDPIAMRAADLVAYQSQEYSQRYLDRIETLRAAGASAETIDAFAIHLHKLMAYKDEYEVARLLLAPEARAAAEAIAGEGARVQWQLHPPMLRALGMKNKISLGRWATPLMVGLRAGRRLRGTPFDLLGMTKLRRIERALAGEYADSITVLVRANAPASVTLEAAGLPELVRGYESIKLESLVHYRARLAEFMNPAGSAEPDSVPAD